MVFLRRILFLLLHSLWLLGVAAKSPEAKLIGGHEAVPHSHPYMVSLQKRLLWFRFHICGGSIISKNSILTAAHCITDSFLTKWMPLDAIAGIHNNYYFGPKAQIRTIFKKYAHPEYNGAIGSHDIAVLRTFSPFEFTPELQSISLPNDLKFELEALTIPGWGVLSTSFFMLDLPEKLQELDVTYLPFKDCYKAIEEIKEDDEENPLDDESHFCTGPVTGGIAACSGDSGGPLVLHIRNVSVNDTNIDNSNEAVTIETLNDNITSVLLGVISWGMLPCGEKGAPTVYTKVSTYLDFINNHI